MHKKLFAGDNHNIIKTIDTALIQLQRAVCSVEFVSALLLICVMCGPLC